MPVILLIVAGVLAVGDWAAVHRRLFRLEFVLKPATLGVLLAAAVVADLGPAHPWIVAGLALGLVGDVAIALADNVSDPDPLDPRFLTGLVSFLLGHLAYVVGFVRTGVHPLPLLAGLLVAAGIGGLTLPPVLRRAAGDGGAPLVAAVAVYGAVVAAMAGFGSGTQVVLVALGGVLFVVSDAVIARERFVARSAHGPVLIAVTYHLAQFAIVLGLGLSSG
ncbi:lysoplasmalogenase [Jatrophihabitans fulvus]